MFVSCVCVMYRFHSLWLKHFTSPHNVAAAGFQPMDPASVRALACASKAPLGLVFETMVTNYLDEHRARTLVDTTPIAPNNRCSHTDGRGRCRKTVPGVAIVQWCATHQARRGILYPGDRLVCHWNFHDLMQNKCVMCGQNRHDGHVSIRHGYHCRACWPNM